MGKLIKHLVIALLTAFVVGLLIGTVLRLKLEAPPQYIGQRAGPGEGQHLSRCHSTSPTPALLFSSRAKTKSRSESRLT